MRRATEINWTVNVNYIETPLQNVATQIAVDTSTEMNNLWTRMLWLALALPLSLAEVSVKPPLGVPPHLASRYVPLKSDNGLWKCLDGSKDIEWRAVNDDYCDCSDGSDEPGLPIVQYNSLDSLLNICKERVHVRMLRSIV
jgi:hypothetical protein